MSTSFWLQLEELERRDLLSPGDLDTTFNGTGIVDFSFGFTDHLRASVIQTDGKIIAAGDSDFGSNHANLALARFNSDGSLDTTFGSQGRVTTEVSSLGSGIRALALDGMGNAVAAGIYQAPGGVSHIVLARYKPDGTLDTTFGSGGIVTSVIGYTDGADAMVIQGDGKIVVGGSSQTAFEGTQFFTVIRYNADGSLDHNFGASGIEETNLGNADPQVHGLAIQGDGKIVAVGQTSSSGGNFHFAVVRYNSNGGLDSTFNGNGEVLDNYPGLRGGENFRAVDLQPDGKIVAAGGVLDTNSLVDVAVARYNTDGSDDTTFNAIGKASFNLNSTNDAANAVTLEADGKIIVAGSYGVPGGSHFLTARINSNGTLDSGFGSNGIVTTDVGPGGGGNDEGDSVNLQTDGKIVVAGTADSGASDSNFGVVRYLGDTAALLAGGVPIQASEGALFSGQVATFTDGDPNALISSFSATIDWGDGASSLGTITQPGGIGTTFSVNGTHSYNGVAQQAIIHITDQDGSTAAASDTVTIADATLMAVGTTLQLAEGAPFSGQVATFTDANPNALLTNFTQGSGGASIDWGDGSTSNGTITQPGAVGTEFIVSGNHTYSEEGTRTITVTITDAGSGSAAASDPVTITDASLAAMAASLQPTEGVSFSGEVASFTDGNANALLTDFTQGSGGAIINWGDGSTSTGTVTQPGGVATTFVVSGNHTYAEEGSSTITVTITDAGGSSATAKATVTIKNPDDILGRVAQNGQWWVGESNGSGFSNHLATTWSTAVTWVDMHTGDFTGTGPLDIVGRALETGQWWMSVSNGSGGFTTSLWDTWNPAATWVDVRIGDFNDDGKMDIAGRVLQSGQWWVAQSSGSSFTNSLWAAWSTAATWVDVQVGDFSGDGKADIAGRWLQGGSWWGGVSNGSAFSTTQWGQWSPAVNWVDVKTGDFNGDGKADIVGRWAQSGQWWVSLSTGSSLTNGLWAIWNPAVTWVDVQVGDFNGDGKADITGRVLESGQWWTGLSTGSSFNTSLWATWSPAVTWVDVQVGDFNGDGKADITGRVLESGQWWTAISTGSTFNASLWATWSPAANWVDVHNGDVV
jgi:uncharacterized delta-60 repeat protein